MDAPVVEIEGDPGRISRAQGEAGCAFGSAALAVTEPNDLREGQRVAVGGEVAQHSAGRY